MLSSVSKHEHFYQVATENRIYLLMYTKVKTHAVRPTGVQVGDNPMATGETIDFRIEGDCAYMAPIPSETGEQKLRALTTELKNTPPVPTSSTNE